MTTRVSGIIWSLHPMCGSYRAHLDGYICWITHHLNTHLLLAMGCHAINRNNRKPQTKDFWTAKGLLHTGGMFRNLLSHQKNKWGKYSCLADEQYEQFLTGGLASHALQTTQGCGALDGNILTWKDQEGLEEQFSLAPCQGRMSNKQCWGRGDCSEM